MAQPIFLDIVGVEGCGHHALVPALYHACNAQTEDCVELRHWFDERWTKSSNEHVDRIRRIDKEIIAAADRVIERGVELIIEGNSFPSGHHRRREPSAHWNLLEMRALLSSRFDMKYIALFREPIEPTFSHKELDGGLVGHARNLASFLDALQVFLQHLTPEELRVLTYRDLLFRPEEAAAALAEFARLPERAVSTALRKHLTVDPDRIERWKKEMPAGEQEWITAFFDLRRTIWTTIFDPAYQLLSDPKV